MKKNRGFTTFEVIITTILLGIITSFISYLNIYAIKPNRNFYLINLNNEYLNIIEILKSDYLFGDHLDLYYENADLIEQLYTPAEGCDYYLYFDNNNHLVTKEHARYYIYVYYYRNSGNALFYTYYYNIYKRYINEKTGSDASNDGYLSIVFHKKK